MILTIISAYFRGCSASPHFIGCESINLIGNMKMECDCRDDLCNDGNGKMVPGWTFALITFSVILFLI